MIDASALSNRLRQATLALGCSALLLAAHLPLAASAQQPTAAGFEIWAVDQADASNGGNKLYIYNGNAITANDSVPEVVDLEVGARGVGDGPGVRPHLFVFNQNHSHAILASVASGHVTFIRAADRKVVGSIDVGVQAHAAMPSSDGTYVVVANQNGKRIQRIWTDYANDIYTLDQNADIDLAALEDAEHPDNAPICPLVYGVGTNKTYISVRGGGLYIIDTSTTPMQVVRQYGKSQIAESGCGGLALGNKLYLNSGTPRTSDLYVLDTRTDEIVKHIPLTPYGGDAHGMVLVNGGRYLWANHRVSGNVTVIDTATDQVVSVFDIGAGYGLRPNGPGASPDLMDAVPGPGLPVPCSPSSAPMCKAPGGEIVIVSMRGTVALTGGHTAIGDRTGIEVLRVTNNGLRGERVKFIPLGTDQSDIHGVGIRMLRPSPTEQLLQGFFQNLSGVR